MSETPTLSVKHQKFADEYIATGNAVQSYLKAGYDVAEGVAAAAASRLLKNVKVSAYIESKRIKLEDAVDLSRERVMREYARLAFLDPRKAFTDSGELRDFKDLDDDTAAAIAGVEVDELFEGRGEKREMTGFTKKVKFWNKLGSLDSISKIMGYMKEGVQPQNIQVNVTIHSAS